MASDSFRYRYGETSPSEAVIATAQAANIGDLVAYNSSTITRAEDQAWNSSTLQTQTDFVAKFLGVSAQRKLATATQPGTGGGPAGFIRVDTAGVFEFDCASATFQVGDLVGPAKDTGNALLSQTVVAVATKAPAVGRVVEGGTSLTKVKVRIFSTVMGVVNN
jgi:hypothetical protein